MDYLHYIEKQHHGSDDFPLEYYYVDQNHPSYDMPYHWHHEMELCYIISGEFNLSLNGKAIKASEGDTVFINRGVLHGGMPDNCVYACIVFDSHTLLYHTNACRKIMRFLCSKEVDILPYFSKHEHQLSLITKRLFDNACKSGNELSTLGALFEWFGYIYSNGCYTLKDNLPIPDEDKIEVIKPAVEYIEQNYMNAISLDDLARLTGMSAGYFCRFFNATIKRTPMEYLNFYRIERACYLLSTASLSITEVGYRCGFNDSSYFIRAFRKQKGITPKQYQKQFT